MFERISKGFSMARSSWHVLMGDKKFLLFPLVSGILFLLVAASFWVPIGVLHNEGKVLAANGKPHVWFYAVVGVFYFCTYFVIIFCNAALVSCALVRFNGGNPTLGDGFRAAMARMPQILGWALVSATVGLILYAIENIHEKVGAWIRSILGTAWAIMTYFVVPIMVVEKVGPIDAVKRSVSLMKQTWGEALGGKVGMGLFLFLLALPIVLVFILGCMMLAENSPTLGLILIGASALAFMLYMAVSAAMNTIFMTAVYQFATSDRVPDGFERDQMQSAFASKTA